VIAWTHALSPPPAAYPPAGFQPGSHAFHVEEAGDASGQPIAQLVACLALTYQVDQAAFGLAVAITVECSWRNATAPYGSVVAVRYGPVKCGLTRIQRRPRSARQGMRTCVAESLPIPDKLQSSTRTWP